MDWHKLPSLTALRAFEAAARLGSFSAAARELNVTHAAIAQHARTLENHYGISLMHREGRGMTVTPEGRNLASTLTEAFVLIADTSDALLDQTKTRALRVAVTPSFAANWLMPRIGSFWQKHPEIEVELIPSGALVDMRRDGVDVAIRYGAGNWVGTVSKHTIPAGHVVIATPEYLKGRSVDCLADLQGAHWLMTGLRSEAQFWLGKNGIDLGGERVTVFATGQLATEAARAGLGITIQPAPIAAPGIAAGTFIALCSEENSHSAYHVLIRDEIINPARDQFVKWVRSET